MTESKTITSPDEFRSLESEWSRLHEAAGGTTFQTFSWCFNWWKVYGEKTSGLHLVTARIDGRLCAVLPLTVDSVGMPGVTLGRIGFIGAHETYGEYGILAEPGTSAESTRAVAGELFRQVGTPGRELLSLFRFPPDSLPMRQLLEHLRSLGLRSRYVPELTKRVMLRLPESREAYVSSLSSNERESVRRKTKKLLKAGASIEVVESADPAAFDDYVRLHSASWRPRGDAGYFASAEFETFLRSVTLEMMAGGNSKLYFLTKDGGRFAAVHAFFMHGTCCFYLSGLDRHHELLNLSPGKVLLAHVIGDAIGRGNRVFDFQGGDEGYKFQLGGRLTWFAEAMFWRGGPGSWKVPLFLGLKIVKNRVREKVVERLLPKIKSSLRGGRGG